MSMTAEKTVRELALKNPAATRVFEKLGIDYCCGGNKSLEEACRAANLSMDAVIDSLEIADHSAHAVQADHTWRTEPMANLISHIKTTHHKYTQEEMARLAPLFDKSLRFTVRTIPNCNRSALVFMAWSKSWPHT